MQLLQWRTDMLVLLPHSVQFLYFECCPHLRHISIPPFQAVIPQESQTQPRLWLTFRRYILFVLGETCLKGTKAADATKKRPQTHSALQCCDALVLTSHSSQEHNVHMDVVLYGISARRWCCIQSKNADGAVHYARTQMALCRALARLWMTKSTKKSFAVSPQDASSMRC
jgi:hypothetical protein